MITHQSLAKIYNSAHECMRSIDGLQPQDALEELLKYLYFRQSEEICDHSGVDSLNRGLLLARTESASSIRKRFRKLLTGNRALCSQLWPSKSFHLSDSALLALHELFAEVCFSDIAFDIRSAALRTFIAPELRKSLGIFLTPDDVVRAAVIGLSPEVGSVVFDPACGSGTFLIETLNFWRTKAPKNKMLRVLGGDINARMVLLSNLNMGHIPHIDFKGYLQDALSPTGDNASTYPEPNSVDYILTNPPFGVYVDAATLRRDPYTTVTSTFRATPSRIPSEILFIEQCIKLLKPGGRMAIVVPKSVLTNESLKEARQAIDALGRLIGVISLPPETFGATGTQTNTAILFIEKNRPGLLANGNRTVPLMEITNVGYDSTGRTRQGNELPAAGVLLHEAIASGRITTQLKSVTIPANASLSTFASPVTTNQKWKGLCLGDIADAVDLGRTPSRDKYTATGLFTLKVGNLTGQGIDWTSRARNFVAAENTTQDRLLADYDIVLTSSAHNPTYIAQKVDMVYRIPTFIGAKSTFVGEVMRIRVKKGAFDPFELLAYLRNPSTRSMIQEMVRGQTAHLNPKDMLKLPIVDSGKYRECVDVLKREVEIAAELSLIMEAQRNFYAAMNVS